MLPVIDSFKERFHLENLIVVADSGLLSRDNIEQLQERNYQYILGARIKNEPYYVQQKIISNKALPMIRFMIPFGILTFSLSSRSEIVTREESTFLEMENS